MVMQKLIICSAGPKKHEETSKSCNITFFSFQYLDMASENQGAPIELSSHGETTHGSNTSGPYYLNKATVPDTRFRETTVRIQTYGVERSILSFDSKSVRLGWLTFHFIT